MLLILLGSSWTSAHAVFITTSAGDIYDITTDIGTPESTLDDQPWWGDSLLAEELRDLLGPQLGSTFAHFSGGIFTGGPMFAHGLLRGEFCGPVISGTTCPTTSQLTLNLSNGWDVDQVTAGTAMFAIGRLVTTIPEPTTLALLGLGLAGVRFRKKTT